MSILLEGLARANETELAQGLVDATYAPEMRRDSNCTGVQWKYMVSSNSVPVTEMTAL